MHSRAVASTVMHSLVAAYLLLLNLLPPLASPFCCADSVNSLQSLPSEAEDLVDELPTDQEPAAFPEIVRTKTFSLPPMTLEEALVQVRDPACCQLHVQLS